MSHEIDRRSLLRLGAASLAVPVLATGAATPVLARGATPRNPPRTGGYPPPRTP